MRKSKKMIGYILMVCAYAGLTGCTSSGNYKFMEGGMYGTIYHISYHSPADLSAGIIQQMERVNASLSMFNPNSVISRLNRNESRDVDSLFVRMYTVARRVNRATDGAFDITVAPLVNMWGFGTRQRRFPATTEIDSVRSLVGMDKLSLEDGKLTKTMQGMALDASSIAKGLGVDLVAEFLDNKGVQDYMVEIGGEVRVKGNNSKGMDWRIGIDKPIEDTTMQSRQLQIIVRLSDGALATSGNYRNYYIHEGKKYAHTIDPKTGYPVQMDILSSSVYAPTCMEADAYATAFMVLGLQKAKAVLQQNPGVEGCFIYNENGEQKVWMSADFEKKVMSR